MLSSPIRVLPDFIIIGAQKCGTTSLFRYLSEHPDVHPSTTKEVHFFDVPENYGKGLGWYRAHFPISWVRHYARVRGKASAVGEASPYYLYHPHVPGRVQAVLPGARFIVLLRDPAVRAHSHYQHEVRRRRETLSFLDAIDAEESRLADERTRLEKDETYYSFAHQHCSYVSRGYYAEQLEHWFTFFGREHFLILRAEDMFADPLATYHRTLQFLGLPLWTPEDFKKHYSFEHDAVDPTNLERLQTHFKPHNERLYRLLGEDFRWASTYPG